MNTSICILTVDGIIGDTMEQHKPTTEYCALYEDYLGFLGRLLEPLEIGK
jgi:hypothetical protein